MDAPVPSVVGRGAFSQVVTSIVQAVAILVIHFNGAIRDAKEMAVEIDHLPIAIVEPHHSGGVDCISVRVRIPIAPLSQAHISRVYDSLVLLGERNIRDVAVDSYWPLHLTGSSQNHDNDEKGDDADRGGGH
ncbi:hypothetical protein ABIB94_007055 [Bradyrhizobium sp. JR7.2]|uniref:hypothetical protein n=1 Tax=Bradyrhizobium sp. JR7.2 TaxID=3156375 RepID=UPI003390D332